MNTPLVVPHPKLSISLHLCGEADTDAISNWCDVFMAGDYFVRRGHMLNLIKNPKSKVFALVIEGFIGGFVAVYKESVLHNLILDPQYRGQGIGAALIGLLKPTVIRAKSNMLAGDPVPFYEKNGYHTVTADNDKPHIKVMTNDAALVPQLTTEAEKKRKNKERMAALRAVQIEKRAKAQADAVEAILRARGIAVPATPSPVQSESPAPTPPAAPENPPPPPTPPVAPGAEQYVATGAPLANLWD